MKQLTATLKSFCMFLLLFAFQYAGGQGQIDVIPGNVAPFTPENLISNVFLGEGVEVISINYDGADDAVGYFSDGMNDIGIERGIVLSSGQAATAATPNNSGSTTGNTSGPSTDADLTDIANFNINDLARYEITFVPISDTLRFRFVFASEEYPEWSCTSFNDAFGFFISGPGINGPYSGNAENIALVPEPSDPTGLTFTNVPVSISNVADSMSVCPFDYSQYWNDNSNSNTLTYDAYLDVFTAQAIVIPCETYTIKLAIADASDSAYDSAVFLEAKSFGTDALEVELNTVSLDGTITEGCADGTITVSLPNPVEADFPLDYTVIGTAINGIDYADIPSGLFIPAGDSSITIPLIAFEDDMNEPLETIGFEIQRDPCNRDTFWVNIRDNELVPPQLGPDTIICAGDSVQLDGTLPVTLPPPPSFSSNGSVPFSYQDPPDPEFSDINVFGVQPAILENGMIQSVCIDSLSHQWADDVDLYLISPGGQFVELSTDNGQDGGNSSQLDYFIDMCFTLDATTPINDPEPFAFASSLPFTGDWQPEGVWEDLWDGENPANGTWQLRLSDDTPGFNGTLFSWTITFEPIYKIEYEWTPATGLSCADCPDPIASPDTTTTYILRAFDTYGCEVYDTITITVPETLPAPVGSCELLNDTSIYFTWDTVPAAIGYEINIGSGWVPYTGPMDTLGVTLHNLILNTCYDVQVRAYGICDGANTVITCCTPPCTPPDVTIDAIEGVSCYGGSDGYLKVTGSGNFPPFTYSIIDLGPSSTGEFFGLPPGDWVVQVVDNANCPALIDITIEEPDSMQLTPNLISGIACNGGQSGIATVIINGGQGPFSFAWEDGQTDSIAVDLAQSDVSVTVTDVNGCTAETTVEVGEEDALFLGMASVPVPCFGETNGIAIATPEGGVPPYAYLWGPEANNATDSLVTGLGTGTYAVTVKDAVGCTTFADVFIDENPEMILTTGGEDVRCFGTFTGKAHVGVTGGLPGYTYQWNDFVGQTADTAYNVPAGNYLVVVTDAAGCVDTGYVDVDSPEEITGTFTAETTSCFNTEDGSATLNIQGGVGPFTYMWVDSTTSSAIREDLAPGQYFVTVVDINNCAGLVEVEIDSPTPLELSISTTDEICAGQEDGSANAVVNGGTSPYLYDWGNGNVPDENVSNLSSGAYILTVTDDSGCSIVDSFSIQAQDSIILELNKMDVNCFGESSGSAQVLVSGGTGNFQYLWNQGDQTVEIQNQPAGTYSVEVTDDNGCQAEASIEINEPPVLQSTILPENISCNGEANGMASVIPSGGTAPYQYEWSNNQIDSVSSNWDVGTHYLTITDANGCELTDTFNIDQPDALVLDLVALEDVSCNNGEDGTIEVSVSGGAGSYSYEWSDANIGDTPLAQNLSSDSYSLTVTDANGCTIVSSWDIQQPAALQISTETTNVDCFGNNSGAIDITVSGGTTPYTYFWNNTLIEEDLVGVIAGTYSVTVTDANGCEEVTSATISEPPAIEINFSADLVSCYGGNDGAISIEVIGGATPYSYDWTGPGGFIASTEDLQNLSAGDYFLTLTDNNGCTSTLNNVLVEQPSEAVTTSIASPDLICEGAQDGTATVAVTGGTGPYSYLWSNGQTTATAVNLGEGSYSVTVSDMNGCEFIDQTEIVSYGEITMDLSQDPALCFNGTDGSAEVLQIYYDGVPADMNAFDFLWNSSPNQFGQTANNLQAGETYLVVVSNQANCGAAQEITIGNPPELIASVAQTTDVSCFEGNDGQATVNASGGTGTLSYFWGAKAGNQTGTTAQNLEAGNYTVTISDENGCQAYANLEINEPEQLLVDDITFRNVGCFGESTGSISVIVEGGTLPYSYQWSNGGTGASIESLPIGTYELSVTDANGCETSIIQAIRQPDAPATASITTEAVSCFGRADGRILFNAQGGTPPYDYSIDGENYNGSSIQIGLDAGFYPELYLRDAAGCEFYVGSVQVTEPQPITVELGEDQEIIYGDSILIIPELANAAEPVFYDWTPLDSLDCIADDCSFVNAYPRFTRSYKLLIEDVNGCRAEDRITIFVRANRGVYVPTGFSPNGDDQNDVLTVRGLPGTLIESFRVYDRWGEMLFEAKDFQINDQKYGWNGSFRGSVLNPGTYIWVVEAQYEDGYVEIYKGSTTLFR